MTEDELFHLALEKPGSERAAFLDRAGAGDAALRRRVEVLLHAHENPGSFLRSPAHAVVATGDEPPLSERPGMVIGPYKLLEQIGEGGFGVVFMAEQHRPLRRKVALKVVKPGMDTRQVVARFEAERQALALMDHPNVAHIHDGGETASGRPYFVMELVRGIPIVDFCDQNHLSVRERLDLFVNVCHAVQHAHQKGIIHRDLKPSNVMVTMHDSVAVVKVIDFGIAKVTGQQLTEKTLFTNFAQMIGTPMYMSPEQAQMSGLDIDTRTDIYALGVLLYELLTGTTPFDKERLRTAAYDEMRRIIREEEPPKPSTRMSTLGLAASTVSANRKSDPGRLRQLLRGDLDWIVMKCLEKDRDRRYETANGLVMDIQRYLRDEPVQACPPSSAYRFRKFARRNRGVLTTAAIVATALVLGAAVSTWLAIRATSAERLAEKRFTAEAQARQDADTAREEADEAREKELRQRGIAETALGEKAKALDTAEVQRQLAQKNLMKAREAVDRLLTRVGQERLSHVPQMEQVRRELLEDALQFYQGFLQEGSDDAANRLGTALAYGRLGSIYSMLGQRAEALQNLREAITGLEKLETESPLDPDSRAALVAFYNNLGGAIPFTERRDREQAWRQALSHAENLLAEFPDSPLHQRRLANLCTTLGSVLQFDRPAEAEILFHRAITLCGTDVGSQSELSRAYYCLGWLLAATGRYTKAAEAHQRAVDICVTVLAVSPNDRSAQGNLSVALYALGGELARRRSYEEGERAYRRGIALFERQAAEFPTVPGYRENAASGHRALGTLLKASNQSHEAAVAYREALTIYEKLVADFPSMPEYLDPLFGSHVELGGLLAAAGRVQEAQTAFGEALTIQERIAQESPSKLACWQDLAFTYIELGRLHTAASNVAEAEGAFRQAVAIAEKVEANFGGKPDYRPDLARVHLGIARVIWKAGRPEEARKLLRPALAHGATLVSEFPNENSYRQMHARSHSSLGAMLATVGRTEEAAAAFGQAIELGLDIVAVWSQLAWAQPTLGDREGYRTSCAHLLEGFTTRIGQGEQWDDANTVAWSCVLSPDAGVDFVRVVQVAEQAVAGREGQTPAQRYDVLNTLGVALYRAGRYEEAIARLHEAVKAHPKAGTAWEWFFLAMAHWKLGHPDEARQWYDRAVEWMNQNAQRFEKQKPHAEELRRFHAEAAELLGVEEQ